MPLSLSVFGHLVLFTPSLSVCLSHSPARSLTLSFCLQHHLRCNFTCFAVAGRLSVAILCHLFNFYSECCFEVDSSDGRKNWEKKDKHCTNETAHADYVSRIHDISIQLTACVHRRKPLVHNRQNPLQILIHANHFRWLWLLVSIFALHNSANMRFCYIIRIHSSLASSSSFRSRFRSRFPFSISFENRTINNRSDSKTLHVNRKMGN